jgi:glycosyltransferase involved in cell wall biosynthesis
MDLFVMPSLSEGMSNAVLEAMAAGLPVVATGSGGNREVVGDGETGFLFPVGDDRACAERILVLARDGDRRRAMGAAGRARVLERFTVERMVSEMEAVYMEGLKGRAR